ncbi:hypothetical protein GCM10025298_21190 [Natronobiforma cellulositropha]
MRAEIAKETDDGFGVRVHDNNGVEHKIGVCFDGTIDGHLTAYPDKSSERTPEENEHVSQARRFAQYFVYAERGYDTVPPTIHPERIDATRLAIASMSLESFGSFFGDVHQQLASYQDGSVERPLEIPAEAMSDEALLYRKDVYLGIDETATPLESPVRRLTERYDIDLNVPPTGDLSGYDADSWRAYADDLESLLAETDAELSKGVSLEAVSPLYIAYLDANGDEHFTSVSDPLEREADTLIELPVLEARSLAEFRAFVVHTLTCQIRDCFVRMGVEPPEAFRVLGYGDFESAEQYITLEQFPRYYDPGETGLL